MNVRQDDTKRRREVLSIDAHPELLHACFGKPTPDRELLASECRKALLEALEGLPEEERVLIHSIYWEGAKLRTLAQERGVSVQAISKRRRRIISKLSASFKQIL